MLSLPEVEALQVYWATTAHGKTILVLTLTVTAVSVLDSWKVTAKLKQVFNHSTGKIGKEVRKPASIKINYSFLIICFSFIIFIIIMC